MRSLVESRTRWDYTFAHASSLSDLRSSVKQGNDQSPCTHGLRSVCWKAFLVFENLDRSTWPKTLRDSRSAYASLKEHLLRDVKHPDDVSGDDPLADDETSPWNNLRKDELLRAEIFQDVERCMPENLYFREPKTQAILLDVLFIYCKLNADVGYRQGMHEILAPIVWVISCDAVQLNATENGTADIGDEDSLILSMLSEKHIEHDAFTLFGILMQTAKSFYETAPAVATKSAQPSANSSAIVERSRRIHEEYLQRVDPELSKHLTEVDVLPQIFVIRWIRLLFGREFPFEDVLCLWDVMFAEDPGLNLVDYICVAMLLRVRWQLLEADYSAALALLLRYPAPVAPYNPVTFIDDAVHLRRSLTREIGHELILKYSGKAPALNGSKLPKTPLHSPRASEDLTRTRSPLRSPAQLLSETGLDGLLQEAAKGVYRRSEQWGLGQAFRNAVQGLQSGNTTPYRSSHYGQGSMNDTHGESHAVATRVHILEERNKSLAKMLQDAMEELSEQSKGLEHTQQEAAANKLTLTIAKLQFVQVHLENTTLPLGGEAHAEAERERRDSMSSNLASSPVPGSAYISQAQRRLSKPSESGRRSPVRAPSRRPAHVSTVPKITTSQDSPATPRTGSPFHTSRPSLASSSFSWMLGNEESKSNFTSTSTFAGEKDRKSTVRGKAGFLFGDEAGESNTPQKEKKVAEDDDGFTLGTLRGVDKEKALEKR